ncbi:diguanylate cyclase [Porticoccaceae bacterium]|nr:diguanylate cyclase [Porticoccaceae bacterium]
MSTENLLGEFKEAEHSTPRSLNSSIQVELEQHVSKNIASGLGISMVGAIFLVALAHTQSAAVFTWNLNWIWLAAVALASLTTWLWSVRSRREAKPSTSRTRALITTSSLTFAALYGAAAAIFISPDSIENSVFAAITLIALTFAWPLTHALAPILRHLFLSLVFAPLFIALLSYQPQINPGFLLLVGLTYFILNYHQLHERRAFSWATGNMIKAKEHANVVTATSQKITSLIEQTPLGFIEWNQEREIIGWNPAATTIFGYAKEEVLGRTTEFLFDKKKSFLLQQVENDLFLFGKDFTGTAENVTRDGTMIICEWNDTPLFDEAMNVVGAASFVEDVTDRVNLETRIKQQAYFDPLTGLPNRHRLMEELNRVVALAQRSQNYCSLLFIDLDHFEEINDTRGHHYGDLALALFAQRLRKVIRTEEAVARLGGDEFVVLLENLGSEEEPSRLQIAQVAEKIIDAAREPLVIKDEKFRISCSIGIVLFNDGSSDGEAILQQADKALYTIKREGKSNYYFHKQKLPSEMQNQATLLEQLRDNTNNQSFLPFYHPILDTKTNLISGLQIFLRWKNPDNELIAANEIIGLLESGSMIVDISLTLLEQIFNKVDLWRRQDLWRENQQIYFTLSLRELEHPTFTLSIEALLTKYAIEANTLVFAIHTETLPKIHNPLTLQLNGLRALGIRFVVDSVGYQTLPIQKLREFDVHTIRISHKLMAECPYMESSWNLVKGLVELTKSVGLNCIAPCVEEAEIHHLLLDTGCQLLQGNLIAPPSPATAITRMLIERNTISSEESTAY